MHPPDEKDGATTSERSYLKPPWMQRHVGNRMAWLFGRSRLSKLSVIGRRSGHWRTTPVAVLDYEGQRYLVSYRGESEWVRNLRASGGRGRLKHKGQVEEITVTEVPIADRAPLLGSTLSATGGSRPSPMCCAPSRTLPITRRSGSSEGRRAL
jgi:deazaflavin-dependent oxidoreductase (nitroreductase family)